MQSRLLASRGYIGPPSWTAVHVPIIYWYSSSRKCCSRSLDPKAVIAACYKRDFLLCQRFAEELFPRRCPLHQSFPYFSAREGRIYSLQRIFLRKILFGEFFPKVVAIKTLLYSSLPLSVVCITKSIFFSYMQNFGFFGDFAFLIFPFWLFGWSLLAFTFWLFVFLRLSLESEAFTWQLTKSEERNLMNFFRSPSQFKS